MTDPAPAIKRQIDELIQQQIITLRQSSSLSESELTAYHARSAQINRLFAELDRSRPLRHIQFTKARTELHPSV